MSIHTKHNGALVRLSPRVKHNGVIKTPVSGWTKRNGALECIYRARAAVIQVLTETTTVKVPKGATAALISGCGAGSTNYAGASVLNWYTPVTEGEEIVCTVGKTGKTGGDSSFGSYIALGGGSTSAEGAVNMCRNLSSGAETPFGKSNTSGYGAAGRDGLITVKWISENTGIVLTESRSIAIPENITGVLVSGCGAGGNANVNTAMGGSSGGTGSSVVSYYTPVSTADSIQCIVGFGYHSYSESAGDSSQIKDTKFGDIVALGGGENAPAWNSVGNNGAVYCATNFSDYAPFGNTGRVGVTPWGKQGGYPSEGVGYGISGTVNPNLLMSGRPGLLILEYVNNKDTVVLTESQTITVPLGVTGALISGCGAGGGAEATTYPGVVNNVTRAPAPMSLRGGGAGGSVINYYVPVTEGESILCTVGDASITTNGGDTSFGDYVLLGGGGKGNIGVLGAMGTSPAGVNLSSAAVLTTGGKTPFGAPGGYSSQGIYYTETGFGSGSNGSEVSIAGEAMPGLLIIQWVRS